jgi:hypothetical protein
MAMRSKQHGQSTANVRVVVDDDQIQGSLASRSSDPASKVVRLFWQSVE